MICNSCPAFCFTKNFSYNRERQLPQGLHIKHLFIFIKRIKNAKQIVENSKYVINNPEEFKGKYKRVFNNDNPIHLEIGMGKGDFIIEHAKRNPGINYVGLEKYESVLIQAVDKAKELNLSNLKLGIAKPGKQMHQKVNSNYFDGKNL